MRAIGKLLQLFGLILLPIAMLAQFIPDSPMTVGRLLIALLCGAAAFYLGRMLEGYGAK